MAMCAFKTLKHRMATLSPSVNYGGFLTDTSHSRLTASPGLLQPVGVATGGAVTMGVATRGATTAGVATAGLALMGVASVGVATTGLASVGVASADVAMGHSHGGRGYSGC